MLSSILTTATALLTTLFSGVAVLSMGAAVADTSAIISNEAPQVISINVSGHDTPSSGPGRTIQIFGVSEDINGEADITTTDLVLYRTNSGFGPNCTEDPGNCIHVNTCTQDTPYGTNTEIFYTCTLIIDGPYAYGDWTASVTTHDLSDDSGTDTLTFTVTPLSSGDGTQGYKFPDEEPEPTPEIQEEPDTSTEPDDIAEPEQEPEIPTETVDDTSTEDDPIARFYKCIGKPEPGERTQPNHTESYNNPFVVAGNNTGLTVTNFDDENGYDCTSGVIVEVPAGASRNWIIIYVDDLPADAFPRLSGDAVECIPQNTNSAAIAATECIPSDNYTGPGVSLGGRDGIQPLGLTVFHVYAEDRYGNPVSEITGPARITLVTPEDLEEAEKLGLYRLDIAANTWVPVQFDEHDDHTLTFTTTELGIYAIFDASPIDTTAFPDRTALNLFCFVSLIILLLILTGLIILLVMTLRRHKKCLEVTETAQNRQQTDAEDGDMQ